MLDQNPSVNAFGSAFNIPGVNVDIRRPFKVTALPGTMPRTFYDVEKKSRDVGGKTKSTHKLVKRVEHEPAGYLVTFPNGHSIRVRDQAELARLGFDAEPGLIDMLSGQVLAPNTRHVAEQMDMLQYLPTGYAPSEGMKRQAVSMEGLELAPKTKPQASTPKAKTIKRAAPKPRAVKKGVK